MVDLREREPCSHATAVTMDCTVSHWRGLGHMCRRCLCGRYVQHARNCALRPPVSSSQENPDEGGG